MPQPPENEAGFPASRIATDGDPKRSGSGHLRTCLVAIFHCDAAAGRPGEREHFSCLGSSRTTLGWATNHKGTALPRWEVPTSTGMFLGVRSSLRNQKAGPLGAAALQGHSS